MKRPRAPTATAMRLMVAYRRFFDARAKDILALIEREWPKNPIAHGPMVRADARGRRPIISDWVQRHIYQGVDLVIGDPKTLVPAIEKAGTTVDRKNGKQWAGLARIGRAPGLQAVLETFRDRNLDLIDSIQEEEKDRLADILSDAERTGLRVEDLSKRIQEACDVTRSRGDLIARDQTLKLNGQLTQIRQQAAGVTRYRWSTSKDERVRGTPGGKNPNGLHYDLDGTVQSWDAPPIIAEDGRTGHPGEDYQCRCVAIPILDELEDTE